MKTTEPGTYASSDASTRRRVLRYIADHGWTTSGALAEEFGLTAAAIRRHLGVLEDGGYLMVRHAPGRPSAAGRPARQYAATTRGQDSVGRAYDTLAIEALETLAEVGGEAAVRRFFEARFAAIEARYAERRAARGDLDPAEALSQVLTEGGFVAGLSPVRLGEQLCQHLCPYPAIAERFPEFCQAETAVFARLLDMPVQRLATIAHGDGVCTTHIPAMTKERL